MSWKRSLLNGLIWGLARFCDSARGNPTSPRSIFILRNNDIGDLLVITPMFEALRQQFPETRLVAGVGHWNLPVLESNPYLDAVLEVNAPWHNKFVQPQGLGAALRYLACSPEVRAVCQQRFTIGLDVLGSPFGSLLLMRAGIPRRVGMKGYAGGETGVQEHVTFNSEEHVGRGALRFEELLGARRLPENRPQLFLRPAELEAAEAHWRYLDMDRRRPRLLLSPGAGFAAKAWPQEEWRELIRALGQQGDWNMSLVGSTQENVLPVDSATTGKVLNLSGRTTLRETFALAATCDQVVCHSSMLMHAAAAFRKPSLVLLGHCFASASSHAQQWGYPESSMLGRAQRADALPHLEHALALLNPSRLAA